MWAVLWFRVRCGVLRIRVPYYFGGTEEGNLTYRATHTGAFNVGFVESLREFYVCF